VPLELVLKNISREDLIIEEAVSLIENFEKRGFYNFKLSLKSSLVSETISLNRKISKLTHAPLHLGVTEAGPLLTSCVRSSIAFGNLLLTGIGDTIRVSITGDPVKEVEAAKEILRSLEMYDFGVTIVSCPTCSRAVKDLASIVDLVVEKTGKIRKKMKIAVMGCAVNGPGEAKEADLGIAGAGSDTFSFFKNGEIVASFKSEDAVKKLIEEIKKCEGPNV
jgi:(E)-4-hydroxy-3-methylbut-2-enyl-diphosphate synthase